ncbi:MAG: hypothetical protein ABEJ72_00460, partial [Candidatus Aenigmatarchaeota archaeon]
YIERNFSDRGCGDIVYITGNPHFQTEIFEEMTGREPSEVFHEVFNTYDTDWDEEKGVVMPDAIVRDAETAEKLFPGKRKIVHFMQPHPPFVNSDIEQVPNRIEAIGQAFNESQRAEKGEIERKTVIQDYRENLEFVLPYVDNLAEKLSGRTVVTADHGEILGENGLFDHYKGNYRVLREVPWDVISDGYD